MHGHMRVVAIGIAVFILGAFLGAGQPARAGGIDEKIQSTFNAMATVNEPGVHMGARRGVITGGGIQIRNKIVTASLMSFDPPRMQFGCGGWDLFAGSFSFISSEQITAMLRSVASATAAYFFKLALATISKDIENIMSDIWNAMSRINEMQLNSCKIGEAIARGALGQGDVQEGEGLGRQIAVAMGLKDDDSEAQNQGRAKSPGVEAAERVPQVKQEIVKGNQTWRALRDQNAPHWVDSSDSRLMEQIMSISGTVIICSPGVDECPRASSGTTGGQTTLTMLHREPILTLREMVRGSDGVTAVRYWRCNEETHCLDPISTEDTGYVGTEKILLDRLLGTSRGMGDGIIGRYAAGQAGTAADNGLIASGGAYVSMALNLAASRNGERAARRFIEAFSEVIAAEMTATIVGELMALAVQSTAEMESGKAKEIQALTATARQKIREDLETFYAQATTDSQVFAYYLQLKNSIEDAELPLVMAN